MPKKTRLPAEVEPKKLSKRHTRVVDFYFAGANFDKTKALRMAGYPWPNSRLNIFKRPDVQAEIERRWAEVRARYDVTYDRVVAEIAKVAFSNIGDYGEVQEDGSILFNFGEVDAVQMAAIGEITVESFIDHYEEDEDGNKLPVRVKRVRVKPWNKMQALEQLMRHAGLSKSNENKAVQDLASRIAAGLRRAGRAAPVVDGEYEEME